MSEKSSSKTILLIEDDNLVRDAVREMLLALGFAVLAASSGEQAIELSRKHRGALALSLADVVIPTMSVKQLQEKLSEQRPSTKFLLMSGYPQDVILKAGIDASSVLFLQWGIRLKANAIPV